MRHGVNESVVTTDITIVEQDQFLIDIAEVENEFDAYLASGVGQKIIFSGVFGSGKTYFLKRFFESRSEEYITIHLYPTNYSVATNRDVVELIKYDILYELIQKPGIHLDKIDASFFEALPFLEGSDYLAALKAFSVNIASLGKYVSLVAPKLGILLSAIETALAGDEIVGKKRQALETNEGEQIRKFVASIEDDVGGIYQFDIYTHLINTLLGRFKSSCRDKESCKTVLIIDDLDRIDPEHIFRIMNVFAAHFDMKNVENANKYEFDHVILCCDYENIKRIFRNRYGEDVDFGGYINKFFDSQIFRFSNAKAVSLKIQNIIDTIKSKSNPEMRPYSTAFIWTSFLLDVLKSMVLSRRLSVRELKKMHYKIVDFDRYSVRHPLHSAHLPNPYIVYSFILLVEVLEDPDEIIKRVNSTHFLRIKSFSKASVVLSEIVAIVESDTHRFKPGEYVVEIDRVSINYCISDNHACALVSYTPFNGMSVDLKHADDNQIDFPYDALFKRALSMFVANLVKL